MFPFHSSFLGPEVQKKGLGGCYATLLVAITVSLITHSIAFMQLHDFAGENAVPGNHAASTTNSVADFMAYRSVLFTALVTAAELSALRLALLGLTQSRARRVSDATSLLLCGASFVGLVWWRWSSAIFLSDVLLLIGDGFFTALLIACAIDKKSSSRAPLSRDVESIRACFLIIAALLLRWATGRAVLHSLFLFAGWLIPVLAPPLILFGSWVIAKNSSRHSSTVVSIAKAVPVLLVPLIFVPAAGYAELLGISTFALLAISQTSSPKNQSTNSARAAVMIGVVLPTCVRLLVGYDSLTACLSSLDRWISERTVLWTAMCAALDVCLLAGAVEKLPAPLRKLINASESAFTRVFLVVMSVLLCSRWAVLFSIAHVFLNLVESLLVVVLLDVGGRHENSLKCTAALSAMFAVRLVRSGGSACVGLLHLIHVL